MPPMLFRQIRRFRSFVFFTIEISLQIDYDRIEEADEFIRH